MSEEPPDPSPKENGDLAPRTVLEAIMFTDIEGSVRLAQVLGVRRYAEILKRHGALFHEALQTVKTGHIEKHTGDGYMARFSRPSDAVAVALRFQWSIMREAWGDDSRVRVRIGIHQGEILLISSEHEGPASVGTPQNLAARVMAMGAGGQVLLTRAVFDDARQFVRAIPGLPPEAQAELCWEAHGSYLIKGLDNPVEIFEVGERGRALFQKPEDGPAATRSVSPEEEATLGWRPAKEREVPKRKGWFLRERLGEGGFGEVWLAENRRTPEVRVFKFCFDAVRLRTFKREVALFRLVCERLGRRKDIATLYEAQLETAPFFLESEYCPGGTLRQWLEAHPAPLAVRLGIVERVARALAAAHSAGIIHKDVKPSNIFMEVREDGTPWPRLADFGIGVVQDPAALAGLDLTFTMQPGGADDLSRTGTRIYNAPEYMVGREPSIQGDIFSLGVLLYHVVIEDFERPLGEGWQRDVPDPLLVEDIAACVEANPARRLDSADKLAERLETLAQRRADGARARRRVERAGLVKKTLAVGAMAAVLIGALIVVAMQTKRGRLERERAAEQRYLSDMQTARDDLAKNRKPAAREALERHRPKAGERDRRGWEWHLADSMLHTGHETRAVSTQPLRALAVSPDAERVAVAGEAGEVSIWSCGSLEKIVAWSAGAQAVGALGWNEAGTIAGGLANGDVVLWDAATGRKIKSWHAHEGAVTALVWHPKMQFLITGGADGLLARWDDAGRAVWQLRKDAPVQALDWREDGSELAVIAGRPARLLVAEEANLAQQHAFDLGTPESALAWRPGFYEVAIAMKGAPLSAWNPYTCTDSFSLKNGEAARAGSYAWSPGGDRAAAGGLDGTITLVHPNRAGDSRIALVGEKGRITGLRWLGGKRERLLSIAENGTLGAWDELRHSPEPEMIAFPTQIADAQWHPIEDKLAVLLAGDELRIVGGDSWKTEWSRALPPPMGARTAFAGGRIAWSPDGQWIAAVCAGRAPVAWRVADGEKKTLRGIEGVSDLEWLADSRRLLLRGPRGWSCDGVEIPGTERAVWVGGLADNRLGAVLAGKGAPCFHTTNMAGGDARLDTALPGDLGTLRRCALNRDRTRLAVAGEKGAVVWLDTRTGKWTRPEAGHTGPALALDWHGDRPRLASIGADGACRIFNTTLGAQNWLLEHQLKPDVVAVGWSGDGHRLMLASAEEKRVKIYDASSSYDREKGGPAAPPRTDFSQRLAQACAWIERQPCEEFGWQALAQIVGGERAESSALPAAARLGVEARFCAIEEPVAAPLVKTWKGAPLPAAVQVAEALALGKWDEALAFIGEASDAWFALARAEALARLGRRADAEGANLDAWKSLRREHGAEDKAAFFSEASAGEGVDLSPWANVKRTEDWAGGENNNLSSLPGAIAQPGGWHFHPRDLIQLAGKSLRLTGGRMLPRSTGWIPLDRPATAAGFLVASCYVDVNEHLQDHCIGSLFLLRQGSRGAVRIPLIYGRNVWDWWTPSSGFIKEAPDDAVAWTGANPRATYRKHRLKLYRILWEADPGEGPVVALSIASHVRRPAPMLLAAEVVR